MLTLFGGRITSSYLIIAVSGVDDAKWEGTYTKETGSILTVLSELGKPIHQVAN